MEIKQSHLHPSIEDDIILHNRMLDTLGTALTNRVASSYEFSDSLKALQAVARLIQVKAEKQTEIIRNAVEEGTNKNETN